MEFRILGPLEIEGPGGPVELGSTKVRSLLALLLIRAGEVVSAERLIDDLWDGAPPRSAAGTLQTYVSQLRKQLGQTVVESLPGGYRVSLDGHTLDAAAFEVALDDLDGASRTDPRRGAERFRDALDLWHGQALSDFTGAHWATAEAARLEGLRQIATEDLVEARLALGEHSRLVPELEALVDAHPLRERLWAQLMLALYRCGRQADALRAYGRLRTHLSEELGIDPSAELAQLEQAILLQEPKLDWRVADRPQVVVDSDPPNTPLPSGTVTLLFTDIEGSALAWDLHPVEMDRALLRHDELLGTLITSSGGHVFKTVGDAFCAAFAETLSAVRAAIAIQEAVAVEAWPEVVSLRVRIAVHTGECEGRDDDYFGPTVNRTARLLAIGHGGQTLVSGVTADLARDRLPDSVSLHDLGTHRLKDLGRPERVFQLDGPGVALSFPALRSLDNPRILHNLPEQLTTFVGRDRELAELAALLASARLVTLTGPGGAGKTRLALQAAVEQLDGLGDGVWLVDLSSLADADHLVDVVASSLSIQEVPGRSRLVSIADAFRNQDRLLLLDSCEHVIDAVASFVDSILQRCPKLEILTTSREPLGVSGEAVFRVPPLGVPPTDDAGVDDIADSEAVRLFVERVRLHKPDFAVDARNAATVARICRRLDGIPLAIELAAARVRSLTVDEVDARLDQRFRLLVGGSRSARERQQTLRAAIDWSYALLTADEQHLFAQLSVFAGGFDLAAVEAVTSDGDLESFDVVDQISALADKNLIVRDERGGQSRYSMLETLQSYAAERLAEQGSEAVRVCRTRHREYHLALAERAAVHLHSPEQLAWIDILDREHDNLRTALVQTLDDPDGAQAGIRFVVALVDWWERAMPGDWLDYATLALARANAAVPTALRAVALLGVAGLHLRRGEIVEARAPLDEAAGIANAIGDERLSGSVIYEQFYVAILEPDNLDQARVLLERSLHIARQHHDIRAEALVMNRLTGVLYDQHDPLAPKFGEQAFEAARATGDPALLASVLTNKGAYELECGNADAAEPLISEALAIYRELRDLDGVAVDLSNLAFVALLRRDWARARDLHAEALQLARRTGNRANQAFSLVGAAMVAFFTRDHLRAVDLFGAADAIAGDVNPIILTSPVLPTMRAQQLKRSREILGETAFDKEYAAGRHLSLAQAVGLVEGIGLTPT